MSWGRSGSRQRSMVVPAFRMEPDTPCPVQKEGIGCGLVFQPFWSVNLKAHCEIFSRDKDKPQGSASLTQQKFAEEGTGDSRQ